MKRLLYIISCLYITSCGNLETKTHNIDEFYTDKGGFDFARIPLIKPYQAVVPATGNKDWIINSINDDILFTIPGVKEIKVLNNKLILVHGVNTTINFSDAKEGWFILIPKSNSVKAFSGHEEYLNWLSNHSINPEPHLYNPRKVYNYFKNHETINWGNIDGIK